MKAKLVFVDDRILPRVEKKLSAYAEQIIGFKTQGITYNSISCHPDVFIHQLPNKRLILASNIPNEYQKILDEEKIEYTFGEEAIGETLKNSTYYNCISTPQYLIHKKGFTSSSILKLHTKTLLELPQAYTRCTTLVLKDGVAITSDKGVQKALERYDWECSYFSPKDIRIEDHEYGFFGGCCGVLNNKVMVLGNPLLHEDGEKLISFCGNHGFEVIALMEDYMYDGGGVFFI
ncbi:hypothetical protein MY04_5077 [Flammeovirga sp. MY04]|uniref:DUF6873 family GME fold protein n=1 Tax=Flammeovirga sp. MY04 TaxID=1191459 RepID=UPI000806347D|nr:hypothetical protein [Flammeovirga sp. MY04]ANQ52412.1 hypothetical protein MY04_5077 [Flammeovirga sp. MY04]